MKFMDKLLAPFARMAKQPLESFVRIETADDETTLVAEDGSLVSYIKVDGSRQTIGAAEYTRIIEQASITLGSRFDRAGYALQVVFIRNPDRMKKELQTLLRPNRRAAEAVGLDLKDLFDERVRHLNHFLAWEECYFVLWTRPSSLSKPEIKSEFDKRSKAYENWVTSPFSQNPMAAIDGLRNRHKGYANGVRTALNDLGIQASLMEVHDALAAARASIFPARAGDKWRPCLPGDPMPPRLAKSKYDYSDILWPPIRQQICTYDAKVISSDVVQIGHRLWSAVDMTLPPADPTPFPQLLSRFVEADIPFRISFLIESGGIEGQATKALISSLLAFSNPVNRQIKKSIDSLVKIAQDEPVVKLRISAATWADEGDLETVETRSAIMTQALESWGYAQVSGVSGDPLDEVMSSALGVHCSSTATEAIAPLSEVLKLLPWQRPSSPFQNGALLFRSPDGKVWPYSTGSSLTTTWFDLVFAQPGAGKSVLMNSLNLGTALTAGVSNLPYLAIIDIGPSSAGLVSLIRDALPPSRVHEATSYRLTMDTKNAINPFDTQLGCREPLQDERSYLIELVTLLATPPGQEKPYDGIPQLVGLVIDEIYRWRNDKAANAEPRPYLPRVDYSVDEAIKKHNVQLPNEAMWWDVVDALFERGLVHEASLAQRHAVPVLADTITASRRPQILSLLQDTQVGTGSESVIQAFERMISSAIREYAILSTITHFDIGETNICALDLMDVSPQGDESSDKQTAIMYMLARHALVRNWWINEDAVKTMPEKFRVYHENRLRKIKESPKRLSYDEFHRTSKSSAVRAQVVRDVREGRKWGVQIILASQLLKDFDSDMVDLATGVWILGAAISDSAVKEAQERFSLSETAVWIMRNRLTGPRSTGAPALFVLGTNEGRYEQHLINTLGPIELWALSTSAEDVAIRKRLYIRLGARRARQVLAANFPGGSARNEIKRRIDMYSEAGDARKSTTAFVIEEIVEELVEMVTRMAMTEITESEKDMTD